MRVADDWLVSLRPQIDKVIKKYSNFVSFPVVLDGDRVNTIQALWCERDSGHATARGRAYKPPAKGTLRTGIT